MLKVVVGSKNPVKIKAVRNIFKKVFKNIQIQSIEVNSGVSHTPSSWEEIVQGAMNRAKEALQKLSGDFGVGLEGGYEKTKFGAFLTGAVVIIDRSGRVGIGGGRKFLLPEKIVRRLEKGEELGDVMDDIQGVENTKQKWGAVGFFTKGYSNRQKAFEQEVLYALVRFLRREVYE